MQKYRGDFKPSIKYYYPHSDFGTFVICAETEEEAQRLALSRDLRRTKLDSGYIGPVPSIKEATAYNFSPIELKRRNYR